MSSLASTELEEVLITLERQLWHLPDPAALALRLTAVEQQLAQLWMVGPSAPVATCTATYSGTVDACAAGYSGASLTFKDHISGSTLGTASSGGGGAFSGSITIASPSQLVDIVLSATGYSTTTTTVTMSCGSNALGTLTLGSGSGVANIAVCGGLCALANLPFTDSIVGSGTLVYGATIGGHTYTGLWAACLSYAYPGYGADGCAAATTVILYTLDPTGQLKLNWLAHLVLGVAHCPIASACATIFTAANVSKTPTISTNCASSPATATYTMGNSAAEVDLRSGAASHTITVSLPT